jgi:hypothetical protein
MPSVPELIDWAGIRVVAITLNSVRAAAERAAESLPLDERTRFIERVNKRAYRERWLEKARLLASTAPTIARPLSSNVQTGADVIAKSIAENSNATRVALSQIARKGAEAMVKRKGATIASVKQARTLRDLTAASAQIGGWDSGKGGTSMEFKILNAGGNVSLSVSNSD